jgi:methionyl-tRNA formyltransferase
MLPAHAAIAARIPVRLIRRPEELSADLIRAVRPSWVVLPDWSWMVPADLLELAPCAGFHAADLPNYRGGSPLQHQILDGLTKTRLCCFRMTPGLDDGDILLDEPLPLDGSISEIWARIAGMVPDMVLRLVQGAYTPRPQGPGGFRRRRRRPEESRLTDLRSPLARLYDWMRALDDPYPNVFIDIDGKRLSFRRARLEDGRLTAEVIITEAPHG